jgi:glucokinase
MKYYAGIDLGGTNIAVGICDENGDIIAKYTTKTNACQPFEKLVADIAQTAKKQRNRSE